MKELALATAKNLASWYGRSFFVWQSKNGRWVNAMEGTPFMRASFKKNLHKVSPDGKIEEVK